MSPALVRDFEARDVPPANALTNHFIVHTTPISAPRPRPTRTSRPCGRRAAAATPGSPPEVDGRFAGYAKAGVWRERDAYARTAETGLYVADGLRGRGVGRALYAVLLERLRAMGFHTVVAGGDPAQRGLRAPPRGHGLHPGRRLPRGGVEVRRLARRGLLAARPRVIESSPPHREHRRPHRKHPPRRPLRPRRQARRLAPRQARGPQPRRQREGPPRPMDDPQRPRARRAPAGHAAHRAHQRQHRHRPRDDRRGLRHRDRAGDALQRHRRARPDDGGLRREGDPHARRGRHGGGPSTTPARRWPPAAT